MTRDFIQKPRQYLSSRPDYPKELFDWLASISPNRNLAWDCATGSGQAAVGLTQHFDRVIATDINQEQLDDAITNPKIDYYVASAEEPDLLDETVDLITVACGIHWFERDRFYRAAKRVLVPNGILAVWTYLWPWTGSKQVDEILAYIKDDLLKDHWPEVSKMYLNGYVDMEFPLDELQVPPFCLKVDWDAQRLINFISTWSPSQRYFRNNNLSTLGPIEDELKRSWLTDAPKIPIQIPLYFRVGRKPLSGRLT